MKEMHLDMEIVRVRDVQFGEKTEVKAGVLYINKMEMLDELADSFFSKMDIELARPGESVRIIPVKDVIEPRIKLSDKGGSFPGFFGRFEECGEGRTKALKGCAVVTTGTIVGFQEGIIDMSGIGADYCYYSKLNNVVVVADAPHDAHPTKHETACRILGLKAAHYLAKCCKDAPADEVQSYELPSVKEDLPKVGIMYMIMAQGLIHDNWVYGMDAKKLNTMVIHPNEVLDGAIVNGCCVIASDKNTTYDHQNNPLIAELFKHHGVDVDFRGCIVVPTNTALHDKERCCWSGIRTARLLGLDGIFIVEEGAGNPEADLMMMVRGCEKAGIKTISMLSAVCGEEGVTDSTPEADAIIIAGCDVDALLHLLPMDKVIGHEEQVELLSGGGNGCRNEDGSMDVNLVSIMSAMNQMGMTKLYSVVI